LFSRVRCAHGCQVRLSRTRGARRMLELEITYVEWLRTGTAEFDSYRDH
jgi:hypothetical protein